MTADSRQLVRKPEVLSHQEAAGVPLVALTAWQSLVSVGRTGPGTRVLVHGAAGGLGHIAVQIARARGAWVCGTAGTAQQDLVRQLGADEVYDYTKVRFEELAHDIDVVVDTVAGDNGLRSLRTMRAGGVLVSLPVPPDEQTLAEAARLGLRAVSLTVEGDRTDLEDITALIEAGAIKPIIAEVLPLERADKAHELIETGQAKGKVVLKVIG